MKPQSSSSLLTEIPPRRLIERRVNRAGCIVALVAALAVPLGQSAMASTATWTGATDSNWADANWTGGSGSGGAPAPNTTGTDSLVFTSVTGTSNTLIDNLMTPSTYSVGGITFNSGAAAFTINPGSVGTNGFTLTGGITNSSTSLETINDLIVISGTQTFTMTSGGGDMALGGNISGSGGLTTSGSGTLTLSGANSYSGATTIGGSTLSITGGNSGGGTYAVNAGGTLTINSNGTVSASTVTLAHTGSVLLNINGGTLLVGSGGVVQGTFNAGTILDFNGGTLESSAPFTVGGGLPINILAGGATIDSTGGNISFSSGLAFAASPGNITIQGGNTVATSVGAANESGNVTVTGSGTKLTLNANSGTTSAGLLTINTGATVDMKAFTVTTGGLTGGGTLTDSSTSKVFTITGAASNNFSGSITGAVALTLTGAGTQTLSGSNNFTGAFLLGNGTTLQLQANGNNTLSGTSYALGAAYGNLKPSAGNETVGIQLRSDTSVTYAGLAGIGNLNGATVNFDVNNLAAGAANGATNGGPQGNMLSFFNNTTFLGSANTFNITGGDGYTLAFGPMADGAAAVQTFNATSASATIASYNDTVANGTLVLTGSSTGNAVLGGISGTGLAVTKSGPGTWSLSGSNTYNGATLISNGTLGVSHAGTVGSANGGTLGATAVTVNNGGTLMLGAGNALGTNTAVTLTGGTFNASGFSNGANASSTSTSPTTGIGALTLSANSIIDFGAGSTNSVLAFSASSGNAWSGTLTIEDWNGTLGTPDSGTANDALFFGNTGASPSGGLTSSQLAEIQFLLNGTEYSAAMGANGEVYASTTAVPEPGTIFGGLALLGVVTFRERRRVKRLAALLW